MATMVSKYRARISSAKGTYLLGGGFVHESSDFPTAADAQTWGELVVNQNLLANRHPVRFSIFQVDSVGNGRSPVLKIASLAIGRT